MDTKLFFPEHLSGLDDNNEHQIDTLSGTVDFRVIMSTNLNERPTAVPTRRKGVFKRFRQWVGKRSRAIRRIWSRRQRRTESRVEVIDNNENKSSNNDIVKNTNNENVSKIIELTDEPETVIDNSTPTDQQFANLETVCDSNVDAISYLPCYDTIMVETNVMSQNENTEPLYNNLSETQLTKMAPKTMQIRDEQNSSITTELFISEENQLDDLQIINPTASSNGPINNYSIGSDMNRNDGRVEGKIDPVFKCWKYRYNLFSKFDDGIMLDRGSFFSVCPEIICKHIAISCRFNVAINPFCGAGGIAIQLAMVCESVIAMDIDAGKIKLARFNATLYGVQHKIKFVVGDFFATGETMKADIVVTSPPWGQGFWRKDVFPLGGLCGFHGGAENIMRIARTIAPRVLMRLPTNASIDDCVRLGEDFEMTNLEKCSLDGKPNCLIVRFCSLTSWYDLRKIIRIDGSEGDKRNAGKSFVRRPRFCSTLVRLRSTSFRFYNRQREEESYFKEYIDSVMLFLGVDDTNHSEPQNN